jgi:membrane fusion protein, copper/silver efflux system
MKSTRIKNSAFALVAGAALLALGATGGAWWVQRGAHPAEPAAAQPAASAPAPEGRKVLYWYDPMKPDQKFDKPGKSPFMDMQLVPRYADEGGADSGGLAISTRASQSLGLRLATVEKQALSSFIEAVGTIQFSERDVSIVQARTSGFVERVYARAPGDVIAAGSPLADALNPEWAGAQQEYLAVKALGDAALTGAARQRLALLGMPPALIQRVDEANRPLPVATITAPNGGVIAELMVRQGMTLAPGMTLARINGLGTVWLELALPEAQASQIAVGQAVQARLPALGDAVLTGKVAAILPEANRETRTLRVRVELPNPGQRLRAGMFAQASLRGPAEEALLVPADAVIRTGKRALVYLAGENGQYQPVEVTLGPERDGKLVVRRGLTEGQKVVASGQFLLDSEASLRGIVPRAVAVPAHEPASASPMAPVPASSPAPVARKAARHETTGIIEAIDAASITLRHEAVPALKWPPMTMPFRRVKDLQMQGLKAGDPVRFQFRAVGDEYEIVAMARITPLPKPATGPRP